MFESHARYFRVERRDLAYLKFILEAYEGLALLSTVDPEGAVVRISDTGFFGTDLDGLMQALSREIELKEVPLPEGRHDGLPDLPERKVMIHAG
jgi:hypothetical protein